MYCCEVPISRKETREEAKTIYDDLYQGMAYVGCGTGLLNSYLESAELPFTSLIDSAISAEGRDLNVGITTRLDKQSGSITFFEEQMHVFISH